MQDLQSFISQLNVAAPKEKVESNESAATNAQQAALQKAKEESERIAAKPLINDKLKGKVDLKWFGHAGFKIQFKDKDDIQRCIYIDIWIDNKDCPPDEKKECPNDTDLVLITHGQLDHSMHAPSLIIAGKKEKRQIVCTEEVGAYFNIFKRIPEQYIAKMQKGGTRDFGYCKITMVHADHPSTCVGPSGVQVTGGQAAGFVITIPNHDVRIYHAGDTNLFSDMEIINDLYKPDIAMLPVGDCITMGPMEAAYAAKEFLTNVHTFIPMHFNSFPVMSGFPKDFEFHCKEMGLSEDKKIIHPKNFLGGAALIK